MSEKVDQLRCFLAIEKLVVLFFIQCFEMWLWRIYGACQMSWRSLPGGWENSNPLSDRMGMAKGTGPGGLWGRCRAMIRPSGHSQHKAKSKIGKVRDTVWDLTRRVELPVASSCPTEELYRFRQSLKLYCKCKPMHSQTKLPARM